jgi:arsenate reductase-like glutaredoxin family protein
MKLFSTSKREATIFYYGKNEMVKKLIDLILGHTNAIIEFDLEKKQLMADQIEALTSRLNISLKELLNTNDPNFDKVSKDFCERDMLKLIVHNQHLIKLPIVLIGSKGIFIETYTDVLKIID